ncbi:Uncharacterised protein [Streptococcus pyogenes]|nr:Uncharacterised protein [Streptococcus pyogenes]
MRKDSSLAKSKDNGVIRRTFHFRLISDFYSVVKLIINTPNQRTFSLVVFTIFVNT